MNKISSDAPACKHLRTTGSADPGTRQGTKSVMVKPPVATKPFSVETLAKALELGKISRSVELKVTARTPEPQALIESLKFDPVEAQPRQAYFFDTPTLELSRAGMVVRARRIPGGRADTVVRLRQGDPARMAAALQRPASLKVEVEIMPGGLSCAALMKGVCTGQQVHDVTAGALPVSSLFSEEQRAFYDANAPAGVELDDLGPLGPTMLLKAKHQPKSFDRRVCIEMWLRPDGLRTLEVSTKCLPQEAVRVIVEFKAYLARCDISIIASEGAPLETLSALRNEHVTLHASISTGQLCHRE